MCEIETMDAAVDLDVGDVPASVLHSAGVLTIFVEEEVRSPDPYPSGCES